MSELNLLQMNQIKKQYIPWFWDFLEEEADVLWMEWRSKKWRGLDDKGKA